MSLIGLLVLVLVVAVLLWLIGQLPIDGKIKNIITVVIILIAVVYLLQGLFGGGPVLRVN